MRRPIYPLAVLIPILLVTSSPALAQYMYLDAGDCTLNAGQKTIDIWVNSAANRDGSPAACPDTRVNTATVILHANGPISLVSFTPDAISATVRDTSATDIYIESTSSIIIPGGLKHLGTVVVNTSSGTNIQIASSTTLGLPRRQYATSFGSPCDGAHFDNTLRLGQDWFDADGTCSPWSPTAFLTGTVYPDPLGSASPPCPLGPDPSVLTGRAVQVQPSGRIAYTDETGTYRFRGLSPGAATATVLPRADWSQTCPPGQAPLTFNLVSGQTVQAANFAVQAQSPIQDTAVGVASDRARVGFTMIYCVTGQNVGTVTVPVNMSFTIPSQITVAVSISDGGSMSGGVVTWPATSLEPGQIAKRFVTVQLPADESLFGQFLSSTANVEPLAGDANPGDNSCTSQVRVTAPLDPNEKHVSPTGRILRTTPLLYHIDFQNVGSDTAFTVVVRDSLDTDLDVATLRSGVSRHPYEFELDGRVASWTFPNIGLPDSTASEANSHGFVEFTITPLSSASDGAVLADPADIYFDFNSPVRTNAAADTIDSPPILSPVPNRTVIEGSTADQPLAASDPEGDALSFSLVSGPPWTTVSTTGPKTGNLHMAPQQGDAGSVTVAVQASDGILSHQRSTAVNVITVTGVAMTEEFSPQEIRLTSGAEAFCLRLHPTSGDFRGQDVDPSTLTLRWAGSRSEVKARATRAPSRDEAGPSDFCIAGAEARALFSSLDETRVVDVWCEGKLSSGASFAGTLPLTVSVAPGQLSAVFMPNPFNPTTSLRFRTRTAGYVRVRIYGPHGRAIRTLLDTPFLGAGYHDVEFDGHDNSGNRVASGIYFYRIETAGGSQSGRVTLLK